MARYPLKQKETGAEAAPTMQDVARLSGVSAMTVSRALKQGTHVSEQTRAKILNAVEELGYVLDKSAGSLSSRKTGFVAAIIPSINNSNFADTSRGITDELEGSDLQLLLGYTDYSTAREEKLIGEMLRRRPEGIILTGGNHTAGARRMLEGAGIPVVETWELPEKPIDQAVGFSNSEAMSLLVRSLAKKGYRKFGYIGGSTLRDARGNMRRDGVIRSLDELGLASDRMISFGVPPISMEQGSQAIVRMLNRWPDTEVVVCVSDLLAFGAMAECQRLGMKVPDDIAFAGFGDYQISAYCHPKITTVHVDCYGIGKVAAQKISRAIRGEESPGQEKTTIVDFSVIERESA